MTNNTQPSQQVVADAHVPSGMPELPTPEYIGGNDLYGEFFPLFTADQMREYARSAALAAKEQTP
jgi:hypothetical protein